MKSIIKLSAVFFVILSFSNVDTAISSNPFIDQVQPDINAVNVDKSSDIKIIFSQVMNAATINGSNIKAFGYQSGLLTTSISYNAATKTAVIDPAGVFKTGETISITLTSGIQTLNGVSIIPFVYTFTVKATGGTGNFVLGEVLDPFANYEQLRSGDIDNDGDLDIIALFFRLDSLGVRIYKNDGDGHFNHTSTINRAGYFVLADLDNDGDLDIALNEYPSLYFYKNQGNGSFQEESSSPVNLQLPQIGDLNSDGYMDIASAFVFGVSVINNVNGNFTVDSNYSANDNCSYSSKEIDNLLIRDFNRDGTLDILEIYYSYDDIIAHNTCRYFLKLLNTGTSFNYDYFHSDNLFAHPGLIMGSEAFNSENNGSIDIYSPHKKFTSGGMSSFVNLSYMFSGDFNGDGYADLAGFLRDVSDTLNISMNDGSGLFSKFTSTHISFPPFFRNITAGDFDDDGDIDFAADNTVYLNGDQPLPVELSSFVSTVDNRNVTLNWTTISEQNNSGFDVERTLVTEGENFKWTRIVFIEGKGTTSNSTSYQFTDHNLSSGNYKYRLKQTDYNGNYSYFDLENEVVIGIPAKFTMSQNFPNPFNPSTKISYEIPKAGMVTLKIFDIIGREVKTIVNEFKSAGYHTAEFNGSDLSSGIYLYELKSDSFSKTMKMLLLK